MAAQDNTQAVMELAEKAWDEYCFPDGLAVEGVDGWGPYETPFVGEVEVTRAFYLEGDEPDQDSKCFFTVIVDADGMAVKEAYAITESGNIVGSAPGGLSVTP